MSKYRPTLKWKRGELTAIAKLSEEIKGCISPTFEIPPPKGFSDQEKAKNANWRQKMLDDWLKDFGQTFIKTGLSHSFIDMHLVKPAADLPDGYNTILKDELTPLEYILEEAINKGFVATPIISLAQNDLIQTIRDYHLNYGTGVGLKVSFSDLLNPELESRIDELLQTLGVETEQVDIIVDIGKPKTFEPAQAFLSMLSIQIQTLPKLGSWKSTTLSATSFPTNMSEVEKPHELITRYEWLAYREAVNIMGSLGIALCFSDYGVRPIGYNNADFRGIPIPNKLIYTVDDAWLIYRGNKNNWKGGLIEYHDICSFIVGSGYFMGEEYSVGDLYIYNCANKITDGKSKGTGSPEKWIEAATNHHITKIVNDLSSIGAV